MSIRVTVWGENVHEHENRVVAGVYPDTMHGTIAAALNREEGITARSVTLQDSDHGLTPERLAETDVLIWWGHAAHGEVRDEIAERVCNAVWAGMGAIFLHSAHFAKPFKRLMGAPCNLTWREAPERTISSWIGPVRSILRPGDAPPPEAERAARYRTFPPFRGITYPAQPSTFR